jgi:hypothetical protein
MPLEVLAGRWLGEEVGDGEDRHSQRPTLLLRSAIWLDADLAESVAAQGVGSEYGRASQRTVTHWVSCR